MRSSSNTNLRPIYRVLSPSGYHWVGDGFCVRTVFSPASVDPQRLSPFVMLDHFTPRKFEPSVKRRGIGEHPHRGFETVTLLYLGEIEHRDSNGGGGTIGSGEVQWMTAASGVVHEELHSRAFCQRGGWMSGAQLWINLPAEKKMGKPGYQVLREFPRFSHGEGQIRLVSGMLDGKKGPARTQSPVTVFDLDVATGGSLEFSFDPEDTVLLVVISGSVTTQNSHTLHGSEVVIFERCRPGEVQIHAHEKSHLLVLCGQPLGESIVSHGPFVMNTQAEIVEAIRDYQSGKMGFLCSHFENVGAK